MIRLGTLLLLMLAIVSCSSATQAIAPAPTVPGVTGTATATGNSPFAVTRIIVLQATVPAPIAAPSPTFATTATPPVTLGWMTYTDMGLHLAVDYPSDWTVRVADGGAVFTSPRGETIQLAPLDPRALGSDESIQPNTRCSNSINAHGITARYCRSTIGFSLDAYLELKPVGGNQSVAALSTRNNSIVQIFDALVGTARNVP